MKVVLLAGGFGTRLSEETDVRPKPMVEIGSKPILWHIMKIYSHYGFNDFIICLGYKSYFIKEYFLNYYSHNSDISIDLKDNTIEYHKTVDEQWKISLIDTGLNTMTGGRLKRIKKYINNEPFLLTYGDGLGNVDIKKLIEHHNTKNKLCTITSVSPPGRFGMLNVDKEGTIVSFNEKPIEQNNLINGGFFVCQPEVINFISGDDMPFEREPLEKLAIAGELNSFYHSGFWKPMDTLRDKNEMNDLWNTKNAPWKIWKD